MTIRARILAQLKHSPGTAPEIGAILFPKMKLRAAMRRASSHLCNMRTVGLIKVIGKVQRDGKRGHINMSNLYSIP
jgi:hypothetical protein